MSTYREKYLKYKAKYLALKNQFGGVCNCGRAECPGCDGMDASSSVASVAAGNAEPIVNVYTMTGKRLIYTITPDMTIMMLKRLIERDQNFTHPSVSRQILIFREESLEPLANEVILRERNITNGCDLELLLEEPLPIDHIAKSNIRRLIIQNNTEELASLLRSYKGELKLDEIGLQDVQARCLADALRGNTSFSSINLSRNRIGNEGAVSLAAALGDNTSITNINLSHNQIGDDGAVALANALAMNHSITSVDLNHNKIGNEGAAALATALVGNTSLKSINLSQNKIGDDGVVALANALAMNNSVISVNLDFNNNKQLHRDVFRELYAARPDLDVTMRSVPRIF